MADTDPNVLVGWQNGDNNRSSWAILWSCVATIFACTWTVLHLGIPVRDMTDRQVLLRKLRLLIITALAPEIITAYAFGEYLSTRNLLKQLQDEGIAKPSWSLAHAYYLGMGSVHFETADGFEIPLCVRSDSGDGWEHAACNPVAVSLIKSKAITMPTINRREIQDRSKADTLSKIFTLVQSIWFVANALTRVITRLPLSPLEVSCLAYIFCTAVTYTFWWSKPKDILTTIIVHQNVSTLQLPKEQREAVQAFDPLRTTQCHYRWKLFHLPSAEAEIMGVIRGRWPALIGLLTGVAFCCIHLSAWKFDFPTPAEKFMWWTCSVASAVIPILSLLMVFIRSLSPKAFDAAWPLVLSVYCTFMLVYVTSRLLVISIMFATLRDLPIQSYISINWALMLPHV